MKTVTELIEYKCGDCGGDKWRLAIGHRSDGTTWIVTICANDNCVKSKREALEDEETLIVWDEFNITGQGHDEEDMIKAGTKGLIN